MTARVAATVGRDADRLARLVTSVTSPTNLALALLVAVAWHSAGHASGAAWGAVAGAFASLLPLAFILVGVRRGRWRNRHVPNRTQRLLPLLVAAASVGAGLAVLILGHAPQPLVALLGAMLTGLAVVLAVTTVWKISIHTAVASGTCVVIAIVFSAWWLLAALPLLALVGWSRVRLGDHNPAQVLGGAAAGAVAASVVGLLQ